MSMVAKLINSHREVLTLNKVELEELYNKTKKAMGG